MSRSTTLVMLTITWLICTASFFYVAWTPAPEGVEVIWNIHVGMMLVMNFCITVAMSIVYRRDC